MGVHHNVLGLTTQRLFTEEVLGLSASAYAAAVLFGVVSVTLRLFLTHLVCGLLKSGDCTDVRLVVI